MIVLVLILGWLVWRGFDEEIPSGETSRTTLNSWSRDEGAESTAAPLGWLRRTPLKAFSPPCLKSRALKGMLVQLLVRSVIGLSMAPGMTPIIAP